MTFSSDVLKNEEKAMMNLRALYQQYGYAQYKMSKFEEYDLYVRNKSFLKSEQIITFNDVSGKLMALRPDVTLSIVKNTKDCEHALCKYFYNENVYRLAHTSNEFKERMQVGLECIGAIDVYAMSEVVLLAEKSLQSISERYVLELSHMGFLAGLFDALGLSETQRETLLRGISEKNAPEIGKLCDRYGVTADAKRRLTALAGLYGPFEQTIDTLREIGLGDKAASAADELAQVYETVKSLGGGRLMLDFSIVNDMNYYNGIIFQGFIDGVPTGILSGGRYDNLMRRFGKTADAVGFAVFIDLLERYEAEMPPYDIDVLIVYDDKTDTAALARAVKQLTDDGLSVRAERGEGSVLKYKKKMTIENGSLTEVRA